MVNRVDAPDAGFDVDTNRALLLGADGSRREVPLTKAALAGIIRDDSGTRARGVVSGRGYTPR